MMMDDMDLVRQYAQNKSEEAFATLVSRHVNLVYSVALRHAREAHLAEEITQSVFIVLARKAGSLGSGTVLSGWLCRTARYVSARALTTQRRRQRREQEAAMESSANETESNVWMQIEPLLETAMAQLGEKDHNAVVLRFLEGRSFKSVSAALGTSEAGAKMRVNRALEKLRAFFKRHGIMVSVAMIAGAVSANSVQAAPVGLASSVTAAAIKGTTVTTSTLTLIETTLKYMAWTKLKTAIVAGAIALVAAGTATVTIKVARAKAEASPFKFAGYATPEASVQSTIWAASRGDLASLPAGLTPEEMDRFRSKMAGRPEDEIRHGIVAWANAMADYKITQTEVVSDDEVRVHIRATPSAEALHDGKSVIVMKKIGSDWKKAGDAD
jgi:RNA polymerase sigma factor (sigma-70 family)